MLFSLDFPLSYTHTRTYTQQHACTIRAIDESQQQQQQQRGGGKWHGKAHSLIFAAAAGGSVTHSLRTMGMNVHTKEQFNSSRCYRGKSAGEKLA